MTIYLLFQMFEKLIALCKTFYENHVLNVVNNISHGFRKNIRLCTILTFEHTISE